jgi:L-alanine-DL-glutamate epimerase-like enolase superfamily enzyme
MKDIPDYKLKLEVGPIEVDIEVIKKVGELIKGKGIRMAADANRGWTTRDAIRASRECLEVPFVMEQPCDTIEDLIKIRPQVSHPIYMDENSTSLNTVISVVGRGIVDGFGMKITRIGGLQPMKTFRDICESANLPHTCDDSWGGDIIAAACTQVAATVKENLLEGVWLAAPYIEGHYDEKNGVQINKGHISVSQKPGLGIEIDEKKFSAPIFSF